EGFQVLLAIPIRTRHSRFGTLYLLFYQAIDSDFVNDRTIELMAQQGAVYMSRSALFHQLDRQISFTEGILSGIPWFICTLDDRMNITWHNNRIGELSFKNIETLIGTRCCKSFRGREAVCPDCPARQTLTDGRQHEITQRWISDSGETRWIRVNSFPSKDETGRMRSIILFIRDITSETRAQAEIRQFARAIDSIGEAVAFTDMNRQIVSVNKAFERIFGYGDSEVQSSAIDLLLPIEDRPVIDEIMTMIRQDKIWTREMALMKKDDSQVMCSLVVSLVRDDSGLPVGQVYTCFDISRRINREKKMIRHYRELEILHTLSQILSRHTEISDLLQEILERVTLFAGCPAGAILLFRIIDTPDGGFDEIQFDAHYPDVYIEKQLPGYFLKYVDELKHGRRSEQFGRFIRASEPIILNNIQSADSIEEKLVRRMGFHSMQVLPIRASGKVIGLMFMFSSHSFHFVQDHMDIFRSIAAQVGESLYGRYLQRHLMNKARYQISSEVAQRIGGDVNQVLQVLEISRHSVEQAIRNRSWDTLVSGWVSMSRHIWQLYNITLNALSFSMEDERLFFPENLLGTIQRCVDQLRNQSFAERLEIRVEAPDSVPEVYFNKISLQRALANLLILSVEACWFQDHPQIDVKVHGGGQGGNNYAIEIWYLSDRQSPMEHAMDIYRESRSMSDIPVLLSGAIKAIQSHGGS
nr:PAS domain-containing protein [bacterium]